MAFDEGWKGAVYVGANKIGEINHWTGNFTAGRELTNTFGADHVERAYTIKDASGSFSGFHDQSDSPQQALVTQFLNGGTPASVFLYLYVSGAKGYYGEALLDANVDSETSVLEKVSYNWEAADEWYQNIG